MQQPDNAFDNPLGFAGGDKTPEAVEAFWKSQAAAQFDSIMQTAATYGTPSGQIELERLRKATIESATWMPSLAASAGIEAANAHGYAREGQNALVRDIENRIALAKKIKTPEDLHNLMTGGQ